MEEWKKGKKKERKKERKSGISNSRACRSLKEGPALKIMYKFSKN
jgi:hypothetical protein